MKPGDLVMLNRDSYYYKQAPGILGELIGDGSLNGWVTIRWDQKKSPGRPSENNYPIEHLIPAHKLARLLHGVENVE